MIDGERDAPSELRRGAVPTNPMRAFAKNIVEGEGPVARAFDNLIVVLIIGCIVSVGLEATGGLPYWLTASLQVIEIITVVIFSIEFILRLLSATNRVAYVFSFNGLIDLLAIAPTLIAGVDARWLRVLRLVRLARILKLKTRVFEAKVLERTRELADKNAALETARAQIESELAIARAMQAAILPARFPSVPGCAGAARMVPAATMGGDFYDYLELPDGRLGLVVADVSGKGVPAAFFMAVARTNLREIALHSSAPGECLNRTNQVVLEQNPMDLFVTILYAVFDPASGSMSYANAGHNPPCLRHADGTVEMLVGGPGLVLGALPGINYTDHRLQLHPGDCLILYTDGITEAFNEVNEPYGEERLKAEIRAHGGGEVSTLVERILDSVKRFAGTAAQSDDITLVAFHRTPV
jgi:serine phosphatase RsbU (regulator of sigma subunit)